MAPGRRTEAWPGLFSPQSPHFRNSPGATLSVAGSSGGAPLSSATPINILLIEDNPGDVRLTREALASGTRNHRLSAVGDGEEAMRYLHKTGEHTGAPRPDLILLDWDLPRRHGRDVLVDIKGDPAFRRIPVIVLTSSSEERDVVEAYDRNANCFCAKPVRLDEFLGVVSSIETFWLTMVKLPAPN